MGKNSNHSKPHKEIAHILVERNSNYGDFRNQGDLAQRMKDVVRSGPSWSKCPNYMKESIDMILHKISRVANGDPMYEDNFQDIVGYGQITLDRMVQDNEDNTVVPNDGS